MLNCIPLNNALDDLLGEGVRTGAVTQIYGPPGSGKSNIALQAAVNCVKMGKKVVFIDTEGSFNQFRIKQMAPEGHGKVLENTYLLEPESLSEQAEAIKSLESIDESVALVIVDSMVYYYRLERDGEKPHAASRELGSQLAQLMNIARKKKVAVLVTNQVYTNIDNGNMEPVGGDTMKYGSKIIVRLDNGIDRSAKVVKHQFLKDGQERKFKIVGRGVI